MALNFPEWYDRGTKTLCEDSLHLAYEATLPKYEGPRRTLARASFFASVSFLEACSNACLESLSLSQHVLEKVDKFPVIQKFDFFLSNACGKEFPYSSHVIQNLSEIIQVRNRFVHSKAQKLLWKVFEESHAVGVSPQSKSMKIPLIASYFTAADAIKVVRAVHEFLCEFLRSLCGFDQSRATAQIFSQEVQPGSSEGVSSSPFLHAPLRLWLKEQDIDISYISHGFHRQ